MSKTVLVTGGLGHIGSAFIRQLPSHHKLIVVDNMSTQRYHSLFNVGREYTFLDKDFDKLTDNELDVDVIVHLAAITNAAASVNSPAETYYTNVVKTKKLIDKVKRSNIRFLFPSSTSVYGTAKEEVFEGCDYHVNPQSPYAESKIEIERYIESVMYNFTIFRFGTIFGTSPGMRFHTAINKLCYQACLGQKLTVWSECIDLYRPYLGLGDAIHAIFRAIEDSSWEEHTFNVLTDNYKLSDILDKISKHKDCEIQWTDTPLLNQYSYKVNFAKAKRHGFAPTCNLDDEIQKTMRLFDGII